MTDFHDRYQSGRDTPGRGGPPRQARFDAPGKRTLTQGSAPGGAGAGPIAPIQRQGDGNQHPIDPGAVQVDQYEPGTDLTRFKDCGAACIIMMLRAIGVEDRLRSHIDQKDPGKVTLEQEIEHVRNINKDAPGKDAMSVSQVKRCLIDVLQEIGISPKIDLQKAFAVIGDAGYIDSNSNKNGKVGEKGRAEAFIQAACVDGSAAMVMGLPNPGAWGWGGMEDPGRRTDPDKQKRDRKKYDDRSRDPDVDDLQDISDQGGSHFVLVWRPDPKVDSYIVMDPSWSKPRPPVPLATIMQFIYARDSAAGGQALPINIMAVPYADVARYVSPATAAKGGSPAQAKSGTADAASGVEAGAGQPLPPRTQTRMEDLFGTNLAGVRVHEGGAAPAVGALAYTQGNDLHFAPGRFQPGTPDGDRLIGHELAHVVQQREGRVAMPSDGTSVVEHPGLEAEADRAGDRVAAGEAVRAPAGGADVSPAAAPVQRQGDGGGQATPATDPISAEIKLVSDAYLHATPKPTTADPKTKFGAAVQALWQTCDTALPDRDQLKVYLAAPVEDGTKRATIGRLAALRGRLEFLLGWLLQGGIRPNGTDWENGSGTNATLGTDGKPTDTSSNSGTIVSQYTNGEGRGYGLTNQDWCGMFVGFCLAHAGMSQHVRKGHHTDHSELASAPRARDWIEDPERKHGTGEVILHPKDLDAGQVPKAGDVVVFQDHVAMVEDYDASTQMISTIDGNVGLQSGNASTSVSGFHYTVAELESAHGGLLLIWRPGLEAFGASATGQTSTDNTAGEALITQLETACNQLIALYQQLGLPGAVGVGQNVAAMAAATPS